MKSLWRLFIFNPVLVLLTVHTTAIADSYLPFGPQNDVPIATVLAGGWSVCYSAPYNASGDSIATILAGCSGGRLMLAAFHNSDIFDVLAQADYADVTFFTPFSPHSTVSHAANGSQWYFDPAPGSVRAIASWGFAGGGHAVDLFPCDVNGIAERDRLCWHTNFGDMLYGWRSGNNTGLNEAADWTKVILVSNQVPEAGSLMLLGIGIAAIAFKLRCN